MSITLKIKGNTIHFNEHHLLNGLDKPNQHPISSIIGLQDLLDKKYIKPLDGIPSSDLAEKYITSFELQSVEAALQALYAKCQSDIINNQTDIETNTSNITINKDDISNLKKDYNNLSNTVNNLPSLDLTNFGGSSCIKQEIFIATDDNKTFSTTLMDTNLKVIEPTILKEDGSLAKLGIDYELNYPNDTTLNVTFSDNGKYLINYISGEISESEFNVLIEYLKKLENKVDVNYQGSILNPSYDVEYIYDEEDRVIQANYTGNVNKSIIYTYDSDDNIISKTVKQDGIMKSAHYIYDSNNLLIKVEDSGTDIPIDGTRGREYHLVITYDKDNYIEKEEYSGEINKTITYEHNYYGDITKKTVVENEITKIAVYIYDENRKLVSVNDTGTESVAIAFSKSDSTPDCSGDGNCSASISSITEPEIDIIFETIFLKE